MTNFIKKHGFKLVIFQIPLNNARRSAFSKINFSLLRDIQDRTSYSEDDPILTNNRMIRQIWQSAGILEEEPLNDDD